jgi:hypothetical protein
LFVSERRYRTAKACASFSLRAQWLTTKQLIVDAFPRRLNISTATTVPHIVNKPGAVKADGEEAGRPASRATALSKYFGYFQND